MTSKHLLLDCENDVSLDVVVSYGVPKHVSRCIRETTSWSIGHSIPGDSYLDAPSRKTAIEYIEYVNVTDSGIGTDTIVGITEWLTVTDSGLRTDIGYFQGEIQIDGVALPHVQRIRVAEATVMSSKPVPGALPTRTYLGRQGRTVDIEGWTDSLSTLSWLTG
jgi:hypothetical protein